MRSLLLVVLACALLAAAASGQATGEAVLARRLNDSVAVRTGPERSEHVLYYFDPTAVLVEGDELEQGSSGHSELALPDGTRLELRATTHAILRKLSPEGDEVELPLVTRASIESRFRPLTVILPGGTHVLLRETSIDVRLDPGRIIVRNQGDAPVQVVGVLSRERGETPSTRLDGQGQILLDRGHQVHLPILGLAPVGRGTTVEAWGRLVVRHDGGYELPRDDHVLTVHRAADDAGETQVLTVGGVRTWCEPGATLLIESRRRAVPTSLSRMEDAAPADPSAPAPRNTLSLPKLIEALKRGITVDQIRASGFDITPAQEAQALKQLGQPAASSDKQQKDAP